MEDGVPQPHFNTRISLLPIKKTWNALLSGVAWVVFIKVLGNNVYGYCLSKILYLSTNFCQYFSLFLFSRTISPPAPYRLHCKTNLWDLIPDLIWRLTNPFLSTLINEAHNVSNDTKDFTSQSLFPNATLASIENLTWILCICTF